MYIYTHALYTHMVQSVLVYTNAVHHITHAKSPESSDILYLHDTHVHACTVVQLESLAKHCILLGLKPALLMDGPS